MNHQSAEAGDLSQQQRKLTGQAEATKAAQRANDDRAYLGRKPSYTREQFVKVRAMLGQQAVGITQIAKETGLSRQTVYRVKNDPAGAEGALIVWGM